MATILVLDDETPLRTLLRRYLESIGHTVMDGANGRDGLALYRQHGADLVITDIYMPEMSGLDFIIELTREFLNVKVIAISGVRSEQGLDHAKLLGARQTLWKPFTMESLRQAVDYELAH
jgi:CheY-like chemotaxis protein